ncbi:hypothetical protein ACFQ4C_17760 [Larkinella insperata]|uniref:Uncharacterized protein n=1 Tax=Larkinella insperata TaxID=332158 RepID=A0ABW3Q9Y3_9BACT|nr:hypothetical protein [Larkinella insperata]
MKNFLKSFACVAVMGCVTSLLPTSSAQAQSSQNVTLTVTLVDVLALTVNNATASLAFNSADAYHTGVSDAKSGQLVITSNKPYDLKVKALADLSNGSATIPVNNITVQIDGTDNMGTTTARAIETSEQVLASNAPAAILKSVGLKYSTSGDNPAFLKAASNYTSTLVYSISSL